MGNKIYFTKELFQFFIELKVNNNREWFQENKDRYEEHVKHAYLSFISDFGPRLRKISENLVADPRPSGGSLFRIYRDIRFSRNKSPYKTHAGAQFYHASGKNVHAPGYYLHLEPENVFFAAGCWRPDSVTLTKIREAISEKPDDWLKIKENSKFKKMFRLTGDSLKRNPAGFDPDHPLIEDIKRKDIIIETRFDDTDILSPDFMETFTSICEAASPFMKFLTEAAGLAW